MNSGKIFLSLFLLAFLGITGYEFDLHKSFQKGLKNPHYVGKWTPAEQWPTINTDPIQEKPRRTRFNHKEAELTPVASFDITGRVVSVYKYTDDPTSPWSPLDFAVTWGPIGGIDESRALGTTQSGRFYHWFPGRNNTYDIRTISRHSANIHIIPANDAIARQLEAVRAGEIVRLQGHLVNLKSGNIRWNTSTTRTDTGGGACEILYVESIQASVSGA